MSSNQTFSKPALAIIVVLLIVTSISLYFAISRNCCIDHAKTKPVDSSKVGETSVAPMARISTPAFDTDSIKNDLADSCVAAYIANNTCIITDSASTEVQLKGFTLKLSKMADMMSDKRLAGLYLEFGVRPDMLNQPVSRQFVTLFISGVDGKNNILLNPATGLSYRYEFIRPCPQYCPTK